MSTTVGITGFEFIRLLGHGTHGSCYLANTPPRLDIEDPVVVVKVLTGSTTEEQFRRAADEMIIVSHADPDRIVTLFDIGLDGATVYYSMAFHPLGSLDRAAHLAVPAVRSAVSRAAQAAHHLHEAGVVHRNIKPGNILLSDDGARLADPGLAHVLQPGQATTGIGSAASVAFVDPVLLRGEPASRATDIYALGATLHHVTTGRGLHPAADQEDILGALRAALTEPPIIDPGLDSATTDAVRACIDPDPRRRPGTAAEVAALIDALPTPAPVP